MKTSAKGCPGKLVALVAKQYLMIVLFILPFGAQALDHSGEIARDYSLQVSIDARTSVIRGVATIPVLKNQELKLHKGQLNFVQVKIDNDEIETSDGQDVVRILPSRDGSLVIRYEAIFTGSPYEGQSDVISDEGIVLTGTWYPKLDEACHYHLTAALPDGYEAISEADTIEKSAGEGKAIFIFAFPHPLDAITLVASDRYRVARDHVDGVEVFAYFFQEDADLIRTYLEHTKRFLQLYDMLIDRYPYKRFSIVENFLPTGYSMPTYTLLGQAVVRLPFIPQTSLGHEILHQWFGNSVYIDYRGGNWAEGLTTFLADHLYREEKGEGWEYRKSLLINYQSYVNDRNQFPLKDFTTRTDHASEAIGYGKAVMVFQMLKGLMGRERFYESIRYFTAEMRFKKASWEDIERAFEKYYQKDLSWFFNQWINEKGMPDLHLEKIEVMPSGSDFKIAFTLRQEGKVFILDLPVTVYSYAGKATHRLHLSREEERFEIISDGLPERVVLDEDYDVGRRLSIDEFPPVIARLLGDQRRIVVLPPSKPDVYQEIVTTFEKKGDKVSEPKSITFEEFKTYSLVVLGADNPIIRRLYAAVPSEGGFNVAIKETPWNRWKVAGIFDGRSREEVDKAFHKIFHYGNYSLLRFDQGVNVVKKIDDSTRGISRELNKEAVAVDVPLTKTLSEVIERVADKKIIYVGEAHDRFSHHVMELEIIKELHRRGKRIAIGMEMFQKPFQKVVDDYIEGRIDERAFLKGTEYFKRWGLDYNLYRPILLFARSEKIPVVALNQRQEIVDKVFRSGLNSLSEEEKKPIPSRMDFSYDAYRERLKKVFHEHKDFQAGNFDFFYEAQVLWDETMSESIAQFLKTHPDDQMVVLAGSGHLAYGSGIPMRTARRTGYDYAILLNDIGLEKGAADFVLFPGTIPGVTSPALMLYLREEAGKVKVVGFPRESISEQTGIETGDVILAVDRTPVKTIDDVKIELLSLKKGDKVKVKVLRTNFFGFTREIDFNVALQ